MQDNSGGDKMKSLYTVPVGKEGEWEVVEFTVSETEARTFNMRLSFKPGCSGRTIKVGTYKKLTCNGEIVMSNTSAEINDHFEILTWGEGDILIAGLGLGVVLDGLLQKKEVNSITVIEKSAEVIKLVAPTFAVDKRVNIINADIFEWKPPKGIKYDYIWFDIWNDMCGDNLEGMKKLHRKFGRVGKWKGSWCRDLCEMYK